MKMKKIIVIGSPGAGKSVFSKKLSDVTNIKLYHLDMLYHNEDKTHISREELEEKLTKIFEEDSWIIDGNYQRTIEMRLQQCDTVFLLNIPTDECIEGAKSRIGTKREDLPWVEQKLDENFKQTIEDFSKEKLPKIFKLLNKYKENIDIKIFNSRNEADNFINKIKVQDFKEREI